MPDLPCSWLARVRLPPIPQWAVRASLDALDPRCLSRSAHPFHLLPQCTFYAECPVSFAYLSHGHRRVGDGCPHPTLPLPACVHTPGAPADQMGGLRHRCASHGRCSHDCAVSDLPGGSFARFTLSFGLHGRPNLPAALPAALVWV